MTRIAIIGAGVVGSATGFGFAAHGHDITFVDISEKIRSNLRRDGFTAITPEELDLNAIDAVFVSVTALTGEHGIDLTHLIDATKALGRSLKAIDDHFPVIVYRCTMPPGTVRGTLTPLLEQYSGKRAGKDFGIAYNPEYLRAENHSPVHDFAHPEIVTLSSFNENDRAHKLVQDLFTDFGAPVHWLPIEAAEFQKYVNNVFNAIKISAFNMFRLLGRELDIEPADVEKAFAISAVSAEGLRNPAYGTKDYGPYAGACLPKDTRALQFFMRQLDMDTSLLDATEEINGVMQSLRQLEDAA